MQYQLFSILHTRKWTSSFFFDFKLTYYELKANLLSNFESCSEVNKLFNDNWNTAHYLKTLQVRPIKVYKNTPRPPN